MFVHRISHGTMPLRNIFKVSKLYHFDLWLLFCAVLKGQLPNIKITYFSSCLSGSVNSVSRCILELLAVKIAVFSQI